MTQYDYIFTGAGASGLSLLARMIATGRFSGKKILLIDKSDKKQHDRTWCFWEKQPGFFEPLIRHRFEKLWFYSASYQALNDIYPYQYKLLRGIDFYNYCFDLIRSQANIEWLHEEVTAISSDASGSFALVGNKRFSARYIFNSILFEKPAMNNKQFYLLQHFKGWLINTTAAAFDPSAATLMDFRVSQEVGTTFVYVMPFSETRALVEFTLFSPALLSPEKYEAGLKNYINEFLNIREYRVEEEEFGVIPMTNVRFPKTTNNIIHLGTAGGQTKPSSGYTFQFIQKQAAKITEALIRTDAPFYEESIAQKRFDLYDSTLLNILYHEKLQGASIFTELFQKNKMAEVLEFLDNETSIAQELRLITVLPKKVFMQAAFEQLFN
ncbi:MAG TPA: lycopene cyclase family protein [Flavitalea sp.]|nr:lycopene cyclase family protein [Flavitalea sp.]